MKSKNGLVMTLVISVLLIVSTFGGMVFPVGADEESLEVEKEVWDEDLQEWVDEIDADYGDTVTFRITVTYYNVTDPDHEHWATNIFINDTLPDCLEYDIGSASPDEPDISGNILTWDLGDTILMHEESYVITFDCTVIAYGINVNEVEVEADEHCTGETLFAEDDATVNVIEPNADIDVDKTVSLDGCDWVEEMYAHYCTDVYFRIVVENTGEADLFDVYVNDTLPDSLEYNNSATVNGVPEEPTILPDGTLVWYFQMVEVDEIIEIIFKAHVIGDPCSVDVNWVEVIGESECGQVVEDEDSATVIVYGMCAEKEVWDDDLGAWVEEIDASVGDTVRFKITVYYYGELVLKDIQVRDELPECLEYADNAVPEEPEVSEDGRTLWWNFSEDYDLQHEETLEIEFDTDVYDNNCEECINWAYINAIECGINPMEWEDPATVNIDCAFVADAGGPYYGEVDEEIEITGSATGGKPPYTYEWDLDDDGEYDDATGKTVYKTWTENGNYPIGLKVTDDNTNIAYDDTVVIIGYGDNTPPNKPDKPDGPTSGRRGVTYTYNTSTTDPDGDQVMYLFDWGDETDSGWLGPYDSGDTCEGSHKWSSGGFSIKVKARDLPHLAESEWSDPLPITMPRNRLFSNPIILKLLELLLQRLPILQQILGL